MEYYYALLENYNQLKRRKFKLSLREEEVDGEALQKKITDLQGKAGADKEGAADVNGVKVWKDGDKIMGSCCDGDAQPQTAALTKGTEMGKGRSVNKMWGMIFPEEGQDQEQDQDTDQPKEPEDGEDTDTPEEGEGFEPDPESVKLAQGLQTLLDGDEDTPGMLETEEDGTPKDTQQYFPGYKPSESKSRLQKIVTAITKKAAGEEQGLGVAPVHTDDTTIVDKLYNSPDIDPEQSKLALESYDKSMRVVQQLRGWDGKQPLPSDIEASTLRDISDDITMTPQGVMFHGLYFSYRSEASKENDIPYNMAEQLSKAIKAHNKSCPDEGSPQYKACHVEEIKVPTPAEKPKGKDINFARRGTLMEHATVVGALGSMADTENCLGDKSSGPAPKEVDCEELQQKLDDKIDEILADPTTTQGAQEMFAKGLCAMGGQCLVNMDDTGKFGDSDEGDIALTQHCVSYLTADPPQGEGWTEEQALYVIKRCAAKGEDGTRAMAIIVASGRAHQEVYKELDLLDASVHGNVGSDLPGQKADVRYEATRESGEKFVKQQKDAMSENEKKLEELSDCTGEKMGWDGVLHEDDAVEEAAGDGSSDRVRMDIEIKARTSTQSGRTKMGEGTQSAMQKFCSYDKKAEEKVDQALEVQEQSLRDAAAVEGITPDDAANYAEQADAVAKTRERRKLTKDFYEANDKRIENCSKQHTDTLGDAPWGTHGAEDKSVGLKTKAKAKKSKAGKPKTMQEAACGVQSKIDDKLRVSFDLLDGLNPVDDDGNEVMDTGESLIESWLSSRGGDTATKKNKKRAEAAKRVLAAKRLGTDPLPEDAAEMGKIKMDIEVAEIRRTLAEGRETGAVDEDGHPVYDPDKPLSAEAKAYVIFRMTREGASLDETVKDVRFMGAHTPEEAEAESLPHDPREQLPGVEQRLGCINAGVYGMMAGVMSGEYELTGGVISGKPSSGFSIRTKKVAAEKKRAQTLGGIGFERPGTGTQVTAVSKVDMNSLTQVPSRPKGEEQEVGDALLMSFLQGQQALLEKLIHQTT